MLDLNTLLVKRIKQLRKRFGISQENLSLSASLDARYINKLENGKFNLTVPTLDRIIKAFGMSYEEFFRFEEKEENYIDKLNQLSPKEKEDLLLECIKIRDIFIRND